MITKTSALTRTAFIAGLLVGVTFGVPAGIGAALVFDGPTVTATADPGQPITEDSPDWDCRTMGNRICGPANPEAKAAGCYDDAGALVAAWPCYVVVDQNGDADIYTPDAR